MEYCLFWYKHTHLLLKLRQHKHRHKCNSIFIKDEPLQIDINCIFRLRVGHIIIASSIVVWYWLLSKKAVTKSCMNIKFHNKRSDNPMDEHPIQSLIKTSMESIKEMVDVNTIAERLWKLKMEV